MVKYKFEMISGKTVIKEFKSQDTADKYINKFLKKILQFSKIND